MLKGWRVLHLLFTRSSAGSCQVVSTTFALGQSRLIAFGISELPGAGQREVVGFEPVLGAEVVHPLPQHREPVASGFWNPDEVRTVADPLISGGRQTDIASIQRWDENAAGGTTTAFSAA